MRLSQESLEFINAPDTVDFVTRATESFFDFVRKSNMVLVTQTIGDHYILGYIKAENFHKLADALGSSFVSSLSVVLGPLDRPALEASGIIQVQNQPYLQLKGRGVLVGLVDTGIDYTQDIFRYENGSSKIRYIYDETAQGTPPAGFSLGVEYSREDIDRALSSENPYSIVPQKDDNGHGTFLASVIAGREDGDFIGAAPDAEIIAVKLRKARPFYREMYCVPKSQEDAYESSAVMIGVEYILAKARELSKPAVICIGMGTNFGSHDSYSVFCEYLRGASVRRGICLVAAAGNEGQERHHTEGRIPSEGEAQNIDLKIGDNAGDVYLSIWNTIPDRLSVSIRSPTGELIRRVPAKSGQQTEASLTLEKSTVQVEYFFPLEGSGGQETVIRILDSVPGIWTVTVHGDVILDGTYHAWLPMSGFVSPTVEFLSASPEYTVTSPSLGVGIICCGAYNSRTGSLYPKSSRGPAWSGQNLPDLVAPGVNVGGVYPFGSGSMTGTSAAAAVLAGACALLLQWGVVEGNDLSMSTDQIRAYLIRGCKRTAEVEYPSNQWGYGSLQLMQTFHLMRDL